MIIDIFNHIFPKEYFQRMISVLPSGKDINKRVRSIPCIVDLDERFRIMDQFNGYAQVICLGAPPIETFGSVANDMAKLANDGMAEMVNKYPDRFPGFVASLPMNDPDALLLEARRAVKDLGAVGVQVFSNILGKPLDKPEILPLFDLPRRTSFGSSTSREGSRGGGGAGILEHSRKTARQTRDSAPLRSYGRDRSPYMDSPDKGGGHAGLQG